MLQPLDSDFLRGIPPDGLAQLASIAREERFPPGASLFTEGSPHADFHLVLEGHVRLEMTVPGRGRVAILTAGPGEILAWSAVLSSGGRMTASATALDAVRTASIPGARLRQLCDEQPVLGYHLMKQLAVALSRRLLATRLQLLDLFAEQQPSDPEC